jgi:hypothetical protein
MMESIQLTLALTTVAAIVRVATRPDLAAVQTIPQRRVMFAAGIIRKRRGEPLRWS